MSLLSRFVLMFAWLVALVLLGQSFLELSSNQPSDIDRLVAARNFRRAIAYRVVDLQGGKVAKSANNENYWDVNHAMTEEDPKAHPGSSIHPKYSLIALESHEMNIAEDELKAQVKKLRDGWDEGTTRNHGVDALKDMIAQQNRNRRSKISELSQIQDDVRIFAQELDGYSYMIQSFQQRIFNLDFEVHLAIIERNALVVEKAQVIAEAGRLVEDQKNIEEANWKTSREYAKTVEVVAQYEQYDQSIRGWADRVGNPWVRGVVLRSHEDNRVGMVWVSIGENEGVKSGQTLSIHRGQQFVGRMRVESVQANMAVGRLLEEFRGVARVHANDKVVASPHFGQPMWKKDN